MYAEEPAQQPPDGQQNLVDQQYQEIAAARTAVLNRELVRMRSEGWNVQLQGDHLVASRAASGRSQNERILISVVGLVAIAYVATLIVPDVMTKLSVTTPVYYGAAVCAGLIAALISGKQARGVHTVTVSVDSQGRPFMADA